MSIRHTCTAGAAAVLIVGTAAFEASGQSSSQASAQNARPEATTTLIGCVQRETDYRRANDSGRGGVAATGAGLGNEFVLVNASAATSAAPSSAADACAAGGTGEAYELTGTRERELAGMVGRRVQITGMVKNADIDPATNKPSGGVDVLGQDLKLPEIEVASFGEAPVSQAAANVEPAAEPAPEAPRQVATTGNQDAPPRTESLDALPRTASPLPLTGLLGLFSLGGALSIRALRRR